MRATHRGACARAIAFLSLASGCSLGSGGTAGPAPADASAIPDASAPADAGAEGASDTDAPSPCPPPSVICGGACVASCDGCDAGPAPCPATGACGSCTACAGFELECFACDGGAPGAPFCSSPGDKCGLAAGAHCPCTFGMPSGCPGQSQVCTQQGQCLACGEDGTQNVTCANGQLCVTGPGGAPSCSGL
jgi:hypothetical protein